MAQSEFVSRQISSLYRAIHATCLQLNADFERIIK